MKRRILILSLVCLSSGLAVRAFGFGSSQKPEWIEKRPQSPDYYIGIAVVDRLGSKGDYQQAAKDRALQDLASSISVSISATFMQSVVETTGLTEQEVSSVVQSQTKAQLADYEQVGTWQDRKEYWAYYRLSKVKHARLQAARRDKAVSAAADMIVRARAAQAKGEDASALMFHFQALAAVLEYLGEPLTVELDGKKVFLFNEIYTAIQTFMNSLELRPTRKSIPFRAGAPLKEPAEVYAAVRGAGGQSKVVGSLPLRFAFAEGSGKLTERVRTDPNGPARSHIVGTAADKAVQTIRVTVDIDTLCQDAEAKAFIEGLVAKLSVPSVVVLLKACADEADCLWRDAFEGQSVLVACAYEADGKVSEWTKMRDEMATFLQGVGAEVQGGGREIDLQDVVAWSANPSAPWRVDAPPRTDLVVLMVASGQLNKRKAQTPVGKEFQFSGEIRTVVHRTGQPYFADRYSGAGGWNPMGEQMCMDVMALNAVKKWKTQFLKHLGTESEKQ